MNDLLDKLPDALKKKAKKQAQPEWTEPMLATLTDDYFSDPGWIYERKLDGERCLVYKKENRVRLGSRNKKDITQKYPELADALEKFTSPDFIADGEIVAFEGSLTSFSRLQGRMQMKDPDQGLIEQVPVHLCLFDLIYLDGYDVTQVPLRNRKPNLKEAISFEDPIRFVSHLNEDGVAYYQEACKKGWERVIAKDAGSTYVHSRSKSWLKFKCVAQQELVIGGYTDPQGERIGFGALLVGYYEVGSFQYAGKVGTGFDGDLLKHLHGKMESLEQKNSPFSKEVKEKNVHWIEPELVGEIGFTEWTSGNKLRHPRVLGLRDDKDPKKVVREKPGS